MVVVFESHFHVEADELAEMAMRVGVLGAEDGAHREHLQIDQSKDELQGWREMTNQRAI